MKATGERSAADDGSTITMTGEWRFYRATGELWQIGNFRDGIQHGQWIRYDRNGTVEYEAEFAAGKATVRFRRAEPQTD